MIQDKNMNRKRSKTLVLSGIYYLICIVIAVQGVEMKEEEKQLSIVYVAAASTLSSDFTELALFYLDWIQNDISSINYISYKHIIYMLCFQFIWIEKLPAVGPRVLHHSNLGWLYSPFLSKLNKSSCGSKS